MFHLNLNISPTFNLNLGVNVTEKLKCEWLSWKQQLCWTTNPLNVMTGRARGERGASEGRARGERGASEGRARGERGARVVRGRGFTVGVFIRGNVQQQVCVGSVWALWWKRGTTEGLASQARQPLPHSPCLTAPASQPLPHSPCLGHTGPFTHRSYIQPAPACPPLWKWAHLNSLQYFRVNKSELFAFVPVREVYRSIEAGWKNHTCQ